MPLSNVSIYQQTLSFLDQTYYDGTSFTPKQLQVSMCLDISGHRLSEYLNVFNALVSNGILTKKTVNGTFHSDLYVEYIYHKRKQTPEQENSVARADILARVAEISNELSKVYVKIEQLNKEPNVDLTKITKEQLIAELTRRL